MTDIIETHGPQGSAMETVGRRPWKAPRLIDLDDDKADGKLRGFREFTDTMGYMRFDMTANPGRTTLS